MPLSANKGQPTGSQVALTAGTPVRFLVFGLLNTVATFAVFIAVGLLIRPSFAYGVAFLLGLLVVYKFSNKLVFRGKGSIPANIGYVLWYLAVFALGQTVIAVLDPNGLRELLLVSVLLIGITLPLTYIGGKLMFRRKTQGGAPGRAVP